MTLYAAHVDDDLLSSYLDGELAAPQAESVEDHLEHCAGCRARLDGLRRVVGVLNRLEDAAPPPLLAAQVQRRVALAGRDAGLVERLEGELRGLKLDSPMVVTFAVVLALATIVFLFSHGVADRRGNLALQVADPGSVEGLMGGLDAVEIDGLRLLRTDGLWRQEGLEAAAPESVPWTSSRGVGLRREHPWIDELLSLTAAEGVLFLPQAGGPVLLLRDASASPPPEAGAAAPTPPPTPADRPPGDSP